MPTNSASAAAASGKCKKPEYIRLPKSGQRCPYSGLSRSTLYTLINPSADNAFKPPVKSVSLRRRGQLRGIRLIFFDSLMEYLASCAPQATSIQEVSA